MKRFARSFAPLATFGVALGLMVLSASSVQSEGKKTTYKDVKPILDKACIGCHGAAVQSDGIRLDSYAEIMKGRNLVVAGDPKKSKIVAFVNGTRQPRMPMSGKPLPQASIDLLTKWVKEGAAEK
ncbi:MAG: hypothetical protein KIS66_00035 [Fimbriimonadaceae bacterium]|nr:hypothetical protein [Fimbriimonadaceae bacterium]